MKRKTNVYRDKIYKVLTRRERKIYVTLLFYNKYYTHILKSTIR